LVRLESFKLGGVRYTTRQAVDRFYERIAMSDLREVDDHAPEVF
jgi:hypothetical protein